MGLRSWFGGGSKTVRVQCDSKTKDGTCIKRTTGENQVIFFPANGGKPSVGSGSRKKKG